MLLGSLKKHVISSLFSALYLVQDLSPALNAMPSC